MRGKGKPPDTPEVFPSIFNNSVQQAVCAIPGTGWLACALVKIGITNVSETQVGRIIKIDFDV